MHPPRLHLIARAADRPRRPSRVEDGEASVVSETAGCGNRFGLVYVDFDTLERKPKLSAEWFREAARQNAVV
jgi:hypothetical protein